jgi:hypothetical protein
MTEFLSVARIDGQLSGVISAERGGQGRNSIGRRRRGDGMHRHYQSNDQFENPPAVPAHFTLTLRST